MTEVMTTDRAESKPNVTFGHENGIYYVVESNIPGLNVEAARYDEFIAIVEDLAPDLLGLPNPPTIIFRKAPQTRS